MTKFTVIEGGKHAGKVVTLAGHNYLMPTPTVEEKREVVALFQKSLRHQIQALANSGILSKTEVLNLSVDVIENMMEENNENH